MLVSVNSFGGHGGLGGVYFEFLVSWDLGGRGREARRVLCFVLRMERGVDGGVTGMLTVKEIIPADEAIYNNSIPRTQKAIGIYIQSRYERVLTSS